MGEHRLLFSFSFLFPCLRQAPNIEAHSLLVKVPFLLFSEPELQMHIATEVLYLVHFAPFISFLQGCLQDEPNSQDCGHDSMIEAMFLFMCAGAVELWKAVLCLMHCIGTN